MISSQPTTQNSMPLKRKLIIFGIAIAMGSAVMGLVTQWQMGTTATQKINWHQRMASPKIEALYRSKKTVGLGDVSLVLLEHRQMPQQAALITGLPAKTVDMILEKKLNKELLNTMLSTYQQWAGEESSEAAAKKTVKIANIQVLASPNAYTRNLQVDLQVGTEPQPRQYKAELIALSRQVSGNGNKDNGKTSKASATSKEAVLVGFAQQDIFQKKTVDEMLSLLVEEKPNKGQTTP